MRTRTNTREKSKRLERTSTDGVDGICNGRDRMLFF
jgi:hypothetical protein